MKEPTIKKETIDIVRQMVADGQVSQEVAEKYFPELRESEDERIRREIINYFKCQSREEPSRKDTHNKWIVWLEKVITSNHNDIDSSFIEDIKNVINEAPLLMQSDKEKMIAWLEKQGEQNPTWSEEDKRMFDYALDMIEWYSGKNEDKSRLVSGWLKSLKPQNRWKPSDEQMADLWNMLCECRPADHQLLQDIYYGLKELKGE